MAATTTDTRIADLELDQLRFRTTGSADASRRLMQAAAGTTERRVRDHLRTMRLGLVDLALASNTDLEPDEVSYLISDSPADVLIVLADRQDLSQEDYVRLAEDLTTLVKLARNPSVDDVTMRLVEHRALISVDAANWSGRSAREALRELARTGALSASTKDELLSHGTEVLDVIVVLSSPSDEVVRDVIRRYPDPGDSLLAALEQLEHVSLATLEAMRDSYPYREVLVERPEITLDLQQFIFSLNDLFFDARLVQSPRTAPVVVEAILRRRLSASTGFWHTAVEVHTLTPRLWMPAWFLTEHFDAFVEAQEATSGCDHDTFARLATSWAGDLESLLVAATALGPEA